MFQQIFSMICTPRSITAARSKVTECCLANKLTVGISYPVFEQSCGNPRWTLIRLKSESKVPQNLESSSCWRQWQRPRVWRHCQTHRLVLTTNSEAFFSSESCVAWFPSPGSKSFRHSAAMTFPAIHGNSENGISNGLFCLHDFASSSRSTASGEFAKTPQPKAPRTTASCPPQNSKSGKGNILKL